jgi:hypothetical protein
MGTQRHFTDHTMTQVTSHWPLTLEVYIRLQANPYGVCDGKK